MEVGERDIIYLSLHCHHQNDFCIKVAAMRAILLFNFNVCEGQSHKKVSTDQTFEMKGEPKQILTEVPLLTCLTPYRKAKPAHELMSFLFFHGALRPQKR